VETDPFEAGGLRDALEPVAERVRVERLTVAAFADEVEVVGPAAEFQPAPSLGRLVDAQPLDRERRERNLAHGAIRLERREHDSAADALESLDDADATTVEVDIRPAQTEDLRSARARSGWR
jgi:hypothetical protein